MDVSATLAFAGLFLALLWWFNTRSGGKLPPGPPALPLIGNLLQVDKRKPFESFLKFSKTYGPVMSVSLGRERMVVIVGYDAVKEAFVDNADDFMGRGPVPLVVKLNTIYSLGSSNGERWQQLRRFTLATLKNFGMGRKGMEEWIQEESQHLRAHIRSLKGEPFNPTFLMSCAVANTINCLVLNQRFDYDDEQFLRRLYILKTFAKFSASPYGQLYNIFPWIMERIPGPQHSVFARNQEMRQFVSTKIQEHRETLDPNSPRDYIDSFLIKMEQEKDNPSTEFKFDRLIGTVGTLFLAGIESTSSTVRHCLNVLIKFPEVQAKMQEEIDAAIGKRCPKMEDKMSLPFSCAVIHEVQRSLDSVPFSISHCALKDIKFRGYTIPKGTRIIPFLHSVLNDEKHWETPWNFNPKHFLDQNGNFKKNPAFMPFSAGKRACVGEPLARMELFIYIVSMVQNFTFSYPGGPDSVSLVPDYSSFTKVPKSYKITATPR